MTSRRPTLEVVAAHAGVGRGTASRVINGSRHVSPASREAVLRAIEELGYTPNQAARALVRQRTDTVAFVVVVEEERGFWEEPFFAPIVRGATAGLAASGIQLILALAQSRRDHEQLTNYLTARHVDGVLLCSLRSDDPLPRQLEACGMPVAMVGAPTGYTPSYGVDLDNSNGARSAALHLLARGRRRLATITGPLDIQAGVDRYTGFRRALTEAGATPGGTKHGDFTRGSGIAAMQALLADDPELDAVFAANDSMAIGALQVLRESGRRVPDDVAVIGFDDSPLAIEADPPLTSVHQPLEEMGHAIARLMVALLNQETVLEPKVIFQPRLVIRQSC